MSKKLVIIPAYNEEGNIIKTVTDVQKYAPSFDYIVVNDCSTDQTLEICKGQEYQVLNLPCNMGIGGGVQTGYLYAARNGYDYAVQFDGDGQHNAKYLEEMAKKMETEKLDMLIGSRYIQKEGFQQNLFRYLPLKNMILRLF
ncbi:MAG: glycosyltransferase family 2 protein, partial [Lachnospiraceae bacterium]|nr:glycosyltransferase family 2 protein [Lachnospiraceae bacterium]